MRYSTNLLRDVIEQRERERALVRLVSLCLLVFAVLLVVTFGIYRMRDQQITVDAEQAEVLMKSMGQIGVTAADVDRLRRETKRMEGGLASVADRVRSTAPWSAVLAALSQCCQSDQMGLRKVESRMEEDRALLVLEGVCSDENPVSSILSFMQVTEDHPAFGHGTLLCIEKKPGEPLAFQVEFPLEILADVPEREPEEQ